MTLAWAVNRLGLVLWHEGKSEEALGHFVRVERLFRQVDYPRWYAGAMTNQGLALNDLERFEEAEVCFRAAGAIHTGQGNRSWWAVNQAGLGANYLLRGRPAMAIQVLSGAMLAAQETHYLENLALIHGLLGRAYSQRGEYPESRAHLVRAVVIEHGIGTRDRR